MFLRDNNRHKLGNRVVGVVVVVVDVLDQYVLERQQTSQTS